jgi:hypothetical protein
VSAIFCPRATFKITGFFSTPEALTWDRTKNEIILFTTGPETENIEYDFDVHIFVTFDNIEIVLGKPAVGVLYAFAGEVESILMALEAECRRLGFVK